MSADQDDREPLVIGLEDLEDLDGEVATEPLVVRFDDASSADPELTVAPASATETGTSETDPEATTESAAEAPVVPGPPPARLPRVAPAPPPDLVVPDEDDHNPPAVETPPSTPPTSGATAALLAVESPRFTGETIVDDLPAVSEYIERFRRPPLGHLVDDTGRVLSHPLVDVHSLDLSPDGRSIALASRWSQIVFGLDPVADHVLRADPDLAHIDGGPYLRSAPAGPQVYTIPARLDGTPLGGHLEALTVAPLGVHAPAWSADGSEVAVLEWRGAMPRSGPSWALRVVGVATPGTQLVLGVPDLLQPGELTKLAFSPCGRFLLMTGSRAAALLDLTSRQWMQLPEPSAAWAPHLGPGRLIITTASDDPAPGNPAGKVLLGSIDLTSGQTEMLGEIETNEELTGRLQQLEVSPDGRHLAVVGHLGAEGAHRVGVIDIEQRTLDALTSATYADVDGVAREQRSPSWIGRQHDPGPITVVAELGTVIDVEVLDGQSLDSEFSETLETLSRSFFIAATHPSRQGWCALDARRFTTRALEVIGTRPWLEARLRLLPEPAPTDATADGRTYSNPALGTFVHTAAAVCALSEGAMDEARHEWDAALVEAPGDQVALMQLHELDSRQGRGDDQRAVLALAAQGGDPRLAAEALLLRAYHLAVAGQDLRTTLDAIADDPDPWMAASAQPIAAHTHLRFGDTERAWHLLVGAARGPHQDAARSALDLAAQAGWGHEPTFATLQDALGHTSQAAPDDGPEESSSAV